MRDNFEVREKIKRTCRELSNNRIGKDLGVTVNFLPKIGEQEILQVI